MTDYATAAYPGEGTPTYLEAVRTETYHSFTRVIFEFDSVAPEFQIQYVEPPVVASPSGEELNLQGDAALLVSMAPASGVDLTGAAPVIRYTGPDRIELEGDLANEVVAAEDWENHMTWAIGLDEMLPYSFSTLEEPARLVVDLHLADLMAVADYEEGDRDFTVQAFAARATDACVAVMAGQATTVCLQPEFGHPLAYRTAWVNDMPVMVGVVFDPAVTDIDLVAVDGSLIAEDSEDFELVDIGQGLRAFAPRIDPTFLREIRAVDADGRLVLQAQVTL